MVIPTKKIRNTISSCIILLLIYSCSTTNTENENWKKVRNSSDFATFFNFAIGLKDTCILSECIDSIEKYKPKKGGRFYLQYENKTDSVLSINRKFILEDLNNGYVSDPIIRNYLFVTIDKQDSVKTIYIDEKCQDYNQKLIELFNSNKISERQPLTEEISFQNKVFVKRDICIFISTNIFPISSLYSDNNNDTLTIKTSWQKLITVTTELLSTINQIKNNQSVEIFNTEYLDLTNEKKTFIDELIPTNIEILFVDLSELKPPPPPLSYRDIKTKIKTAANTRLWSQAG